MSKSRIETEKWDGVKASGTSTLELEGGQGGYKYHSIANQITHEVATVETPMSDADIALHVKKVRLQAGKETLWSLTGPQLLMRNSRYKMPAYEGILPMVFAAPYFNNPVEEDHLAFGTLDIPKPVIEIDWSDDVDTPRMKSWAVTYDQPNEPLGRFTMLEDTFFGAQAAAGTYDIGPAGMPWVDNGFNLKALHIDTENIAKVEMREDGRDFEEVDTDIAPFFDDLMSFRTGGRTNVAGWTHVDFAGNRITDMRLTENWIKPRLRLTTTAAEDFSILYEVVVNGLPNRRNAAA